MQNTVLRPVPKKIFHYTFLKYCKAEKVNIFYLHQRDLLVLNEGNPNFEILKESTFIIFGIR